MMKDKRFTSKLQPYFSEIYQLKKHENTYKNIVDYLQKKHNIKISEASLCTFLKSRERRGIKPTKKDFINALRKDDGSKNKINIIDLKQNKSVKKEAQKFKEEKKPLNKNAGKFDEIMRELGIN